MEQHSLLHGGQGESAGEGSSIHGFVSALNCPKYLHQAGRVWFLMLMESRMRPKACDTPAQQWAPSGRCLSSVAPLAVPPGPLRAGTGQIHTTCKRHQRILSALGYKVDEFLPVRLIHYIHRNGNARRQHLGGMPPVTRNEQHFPGFQSKNNGLSFCEEWIFIEIGIVDAIYQREILLFRPGIEKLFLTRRIDDEFLLTVYLHQECMRSDSVIMQYRESPSLSTDI